MDLKTGGEDHTENIYWDNGIDKQSSFGFICQLSIKSEAPWNVLESLFHILNYLAKCNLEKNNIRVQKAFRNDHNFRYLCGFTLQ